MVKLLFRKRDILKLTVMTLVCSILAVFMHVSFRGEIINLEEAFLQARDGYIVLGNGDYHSDAIICTFPMVLSFFFIVSIFSQDIDIAKSFVLHRAKNNNAWFRLKYFQNAVYCFYICLVYHIAMVLLMVLLGSKAENIGTVLLYILWGTVTEFMILTIYTTLYSIISLFTKPHIASAVAAIFFVVCIAMFFVIDVKHTQYYLLTSYFISWHLSSNINSVNYSFPTWTYYAALCFIVGVELIIANKIIKKKDFI